MVVVLKILNLKISELLSDQFEPIQPYHLTEKEGTEVSYTFETEHGVEYVIRYVYSNEYYFDDSLDIGDTEILEFQFAPINRGIKLIKDDRVAETLASSMQKVLKTKKNALLYICDSSDGKQAARSRLFDQWFNSYSWEMVEKHDGKIKNPNAPASEYVSIIVNKENPFIQDVVDAFNYVMESDK
jgi:hypothetical protein